MIYSGNKKIIHSFNNSFHKDGQCAQVAGRMIKVIKSEIEKAAIAVRINYSNSKWY